MKRALLVVIGLAFLVAPGGVDAQESMPVSVVEVGWWSDRPTAIAQSDQGFEVASGPTGDAQSVAAIRLSIAPGTVSSLEIKLDEASGLGAQFGVLQVCTTTAQWTAANPGDLADAPASDCAAAVNLTRTTDGFWIGDISRLAASGGEVSLMIVPVYQPPVPVGPGMIVTIAAGEFAASGTPGGTTETTFDSGGFVEPPADDFFVPTDGGSFGVGEQEFTPSFGPTETTAAPSVPADPTVSADDDFALDPIANEGETKPWGRLIVLIPLCAAFGVGGAYLRRFLGERGFLPT